MAVARKATKSATARVSRRRRKMQYFPERKKEWAEKSAATYASAAAAKKTGQNHLATDQTVAADVVHIPVVDTGTIPV